MQGVRVGLLDATHGLLEGMADIGASRPDIPPMTFLWNLKTVVLRELGKLHVTIRLFQGNGILLVVNVGESLEEQQRENISLEVGCVDRTSQDIGRLPKMPGEGSDIQIN